MRRILFVITFALLATSAHATIDSMHFEPAVSDSLHSVDAVINGDEGCIIQPAAHTVMRNGSTLQVQLIYLSSICLSVPSTWRYVVPLGTLPAGVYDVVVTGAIGPKPGTFRQTLIVRELGTVRFDVAAVPIAGGKLRVEGEADSISFDGSPFVPIANGFVNVPPHTPGTVDVTVRMFDGSTQTMKAAISYYDPDTPPDLALFEPILFPIAYNGGGAFGSQWATENMFDLTSSGAVFRATPDLGASHPEGLLVWAFRGTVSDVDAQSRIRETTRNDMGVEVPVVREVDFRHPHGDFHGRRLRILGMPVRANARYTLRLYALGDPGFVTLAYSTRVALSKTNTDGLWFAAIDVTDTITRGSATLDVQTDVLHDVPYWAMVSITDNATQQVTIVSPQ